MVSQLKQILRASKLLCTSRLLTRCLIYGLAAGIVLISACSGTKESIARKSERNGLRLSWYSPSVFSSANKYTEPNICVFEEQRSFVIKINEASESIHYFTQNLGKFAALGWQGTDREIAEKFYSQIDFDIAKQDAQLITENKQASLDKKWQLRFPPIGYDNPIAKTKPENIYRVKAIYDFILRSPNELEFKVGYQRGGQIEIYVDSYIFKRVEEKKWRLKSHGISDPRLVGRYYDYYSFELPKPNKTNAVDPYLNQYPIDHLAHLWKAWDDGNYSGIECSFTYR